ncbi:hypothetical protein LTR56_011518 [Elasticomyces elasticus]|nr:hypothetical protein LTR56_011518 [Elasticomyces elasticus]KAK3643247.1 hypothetical protein LTR22_015714 [Elasticomyces elasticus]KAK4930238.1 hypothetical protein LTR49_003272 [Elasticomyces elasticus]KAK5761401.1 hypothetical protein LTS12_008505 [Elasticomyces elasticus]
MFTRRPPGCFLCVPLRSGPPSPYRDCYRRCVQPHQPWVIFDDEDAGIADFFELERSAIGREHPQTISSASDGKGRLSLETAQDYDGAPVSTSQVLETQLTRLMSLEPAAEVEAKSGRAATFTMRLLKALRKIGRMQKAPQRSPYLRPASTASIFRILDLPAELRMQIFQRIADSVQGEYDDNERTRLIDNEGTRISAEQQQQLKLALYRRQNRFLETQLISRQIRAEFLSAWSERTVHFGGLLDPNRYQDPDGCTKSSIERIPHAIWFTARNFLSDLERQFSVGRKVQHLKFSVREPACAYWPYYRKGPTQLLAQIGCETIHGVSIDWTFRLHIRS